MRVLPLIILSLQIASPASASTYEALCGDVPCTINLDASGIFSPSGYIPTPRIAQWFTGGQESYNVGSGTAGALGAATAGAIGGGLLLGPIGLVGGLIGGAIAGSKAGKTADLFFNVVGYDQRGKKTTMSFRFLNPKPANRLKMELPMFTGLAMGQTRSLEELRDALASGSNAGGSTAPLPETIAPSSALQQTKAGSALPESLKPEQPERVLLGTSSESQWHSYLTEKGLEQWAMNNPMLAKQLKQRLYPNP